MTAETNHEIVWADRYGGNWPPVETVCSGQCEGMGCYPEDDPTVRPDEGEITADGWRFLVCHDCGGSGRKATE